MAGKKQLDMLSGSLWDKILLFALPIAASGILQQLFNSADVAIAGKFAGKEALAAVGVNSPVFNLFVNLFLGLAVGANALIARCIGLNDRERTSRAVHTAILVAVFSGLFIAALGQFIARPILIAIDTPANVLDLAVLYLRICFLGMPFMLLYNFVAAILRSRGDTRRPLIVLTIAGVINVILNLYFVIICGMSVDGVAIATVIANSISAAVMIVILLKEQGTLRLEPKKLKMDWTSFKIMAQIGIPSGCQSALFSISNIIIQLAIDGLGDVAVAGSSAGHNIEILPYFVLNAFGQAAITFVGQNYGAGNFERCRKASRDALMLSLACGYSFSLILFAFGRPLCSIFTSDADVLEIAYLRITVILLFELLNVAVEALSGSMRGYGHSLLPAVICIFGICGVRIVWVFTAFAFTKSYFVLMLAYPISWGLTLIGIIIAYFITRNRVEKEGIVNW